MNTLKTGKKMFSITVIQLYKFLLMPLFVSKRTIIKSFAFGRSFVHMQTTKV